MKAVAFWNKIKTLKLYRDLKLSEGKWLSFFENGDRFKIEDEAVNIDRVIYATNNADPNIGNVLFLDEKGVIDGGIAVVTADRYTDLIETMKKIQRGELEVGEVLTSNEEWKRNVFKHIFSKQ